MIKLTPKQKAHIALAALKGEKISKLSLACGKQGFCPKGTALVWGLEKIVELSRVRRIFTRKL